MLSPETTEGALGALIGGSRVVNPSSPDCEASAVKGAIIVTPIAATTKIVANEKTFAAVTMELFSFFLLLLRLCFISVPSTNTIDKRIPLLIGQVTQKNT